MLAIDGSFGEGGGQILRSSLALSIVTATPFRIEKIRAGRSKPGLQRQHLTAVRAAVEVSAAAVEGAEVGSSELEFHPGKASPGDYRFAIGTAGSASLVLQTVLPALLCAPGRSTLLLEGGTHNPNAPPFEFLAKAFLPLVGRMGPRVTAELERPGFFPAGGGRMRVAIEPAERLAGIEVLERGQVRRRSACAVFSRLPRHIAEREIKVLQQKLGWPRDSFAIEEVEDAQGPGNVVTVEVESDALCEVFTAFGELGRPAETVARDAVRQCQRYLRGEAPVGEHLADQLLLPLALARAGSFRTLALTQHSVTHITLIRKFLDLEIRTDELQSGEVVVRVG